MALPYPPPSSPLPRARCRFCGNENTLVKAHIIPRSLYKLTRGTGKACIELQVSKKKLNKKHWQSGLHDSQIVCIQCERIFSPYDMHGHDVFTKVFATKRPLVGTDLMVHGLHLENVDYCKLKLFILSLLWRASVSTLPFFAQISLENDEDKVKKMIESGSCGNLDDFPFICIHRTDHPYPMSLVAPRKLNFAGYNCFVFYLPKVEIVIGADKGKFPNEFSDMVIGPYAPHSLIFLPFDQSVESQYLDRMKNLLRQRNHN
jgi:hypothetical protein